MRIKFESNRNRFKNGFEIPKDKERAIYREIVGQALLRLSGKYMTNETAEKAFRGVVNGTNGYYNGILLNTTALDIYLSVDGSDVITIPELMEINRALKDLVVNYEGREELYSIGLKTLKESISRPKIPIFHNEVKKLIKELSNEHKDDIVVYEELRQKLYRFTKCPAYKVGDKILDIIYIMDRHIPRTNGDIVIDICGKKFKVTKKNLYAMSC